MKPWQRILNWFFGLLLLLMATAIFGMGGKLPALLLLSMSLLLLPPVRILVFRLTGNRLKGWGRGLLLVLLWAGFMLSIMLNSATSIYKSPEHEAKFQKLYTEKLAEWPVPYESRFVDTEYGRVYVIVWGKSGAEPVLLLHASAIAAWSWLPNAAALGQKYRLYAPDTIGDVGKSVLKDLDRTLAGGEAGGPQIAEYYSDLTNKLGFDQSHVIGASVGGFQATHYALHAPERVKKLVLLGSMGYGATDMTILGITFASSFPLKPIQDWAFQWAFGDAAPVREQYEEWFRLVLNGSMPKPPRPASFTPDQLQQLKVPVLTYFGTRDGVLGDAEAAKHLAGNIPEVNIRIVESGHLIGAEIPEIINEEILEFLKD